MKTKSRPKIGDLYLDPKDLSSNTTDNDQDKANILATFFESVYTREDVSAIPSLSSFVPNDIKINNVDTTESIVSKKLEKLKIDKSPGPDGFHPRILKELKSSIAYPLSILYSQSVQSGSIPMAWKEARISAIFKKGDKKNAGNYRPVSLTSVVCKVLEGIIRDHICLFKQV